MRMQSAAVEVAVSRMIRVEGKTVSRRGGGRGQGPNDGE